MEQKSNFLPMLIIGLLVLGGAIFLFSGMGSDEDTVVMNDAETRTITPTNPDTDVEQVMEESDTMVQSESEMIEQAAGMYSEFSPEKLAHADGDVVLFFHSESCGSCKATEKDLNERMSDIPEDLTVLQLDFNSETEEDMELRKKYGVTTYHTFVQVDSEGTEVKKWSGTRTLDAITSEVI